MSEHAHQRANVARAAPASGALGGLLQRKCACGVWAGLAEECDECGRNKLTLQRRAEAPAAPPVPPAADSAPGAAGRPLEEGTRRRMESHFGHDFGRVRVHADGTAAESARAVGALAYTVGRDVVFGAGRYELETARGRELLAHELAHVVQQEGAGGAPAAPEAALESDADACATAVLRGGRAEVTRSAPRGGLQRQTGPQGATAAVASGPTCGDIILDAAARKDIVEGQTFFTDPDRTRLSVNASMGLCFDPTHTQPADRYRWQQLKEIVTLGHAEIKKVARTDKFKIRFMQGESLTEKEISLGSQAGGVQAALLERPSVAQNVYPAEKEFKALSPKDKYDQVVYADAGSLAHEFFGHLWLATKGVPYYHPPTVEDVEEDKKRKLTPAEKLETEGRLERLGKLRQEHGVKDPFGRVYTGRVRSHMLNYADSPTGAASPTLGVGGPELLGAINEIRDLGSLYHSKIKQQPRPQNTPQLTKGQPPPKSVVAAWNRLNANYVALQNNPDADTAAPSSAGATGAQQAKPRRRPAVTSRWVLNTLKEIVTTEFTQDERDVFLDFIKRQGRNNLGRALCFDITGIPC